MPSSELRTTDEVARRSGHDEERERGQGLVSLRSAVGRGRLDGVGQRGTRQTPHQGHPRPEESRKTLYLQRKDFLTYKFNLVIQFTSTMTSVLYADFTKGNKIQG